MRNVHTGNGNGVGNSNGHTRYVVMPKDFSPYDWATTQKLRNAGFKPLQVDEKILPSAAALLGGMYDAVVIINCDYQEQMGYKSGMARKIKSHIPDTRVICLTPYGRNIKAPADVFDGVYPRVSLSDENSDLMFFMKGKNTSSETKQKGNVLV